MYNFKEGNTHSPGRPKGSRNKSIINKTEAFRSAITEQDWKDLAIDILDRLRDPATSNGDFVKLIGVLTKSTILTADTELVVEAEEKRLNATQIAEMREFIDRLEEEEDEVSV